jgi:hypothetical protein
MTFLSWDAMQLYQELPELLFRELNDDIDATRLYNTGL